MKKVSGFSFLVSREGLFVEAGPHNPSAWMKAVSRFSLLVSRETTVAGCRFLVSAIAEAGAVAPALAEMFADASVLESDGAAGIGTDPKAFMFSPKNKTARDLSRAVSESYA